MGGTPANLTINCGSVQTALTLSTLNVNSSYTPQSNRTLTFTNLNIGATGDGTQANVTPLKSRPVGYKPYRTY